MVFFDFEFSGFGHALLDGAYLRLPFPTCWCMGAIPADIQSNAENIYRSELAKNCPPASDNHAFRRAMLAACAHWTIRTVAWALEIALQADEKWGIATLRQRHIYRLESLARQLEESGYLTEIGRIAANLAIALRNRWQVDDLEMPVYPAFR